MSEPLKRLSPELRNQLSSEYETLWGDKFTQDSRCGLVSRTIAIKYGLIMVDGIFRFDHPRRLGLSLKHYWTHTWLEDIDGVIIDLNAQQFNPWITNPFPRGVVYAEPGSDVARKYEPDGKGKWVHDKHDFFRRLENPV